MDDFFFCMGTVVFFILLFGFIALLRYIGYRETVMLAEKGLVKPERRSGGGNGSLVWGILITAVGTALCIGLAPIGFLIDRFGGFPMFVGPWLLPGLVPMFFGIGLILIYVLTREAKPKEVVQETRFVTQAAPVPPSTVTVVEPAPIVTSTMTPPVVSPSDEPPLV